MVLEALAEWRDVMAEKGPTMPHTSLSGTGEGLELSKKNSRDNCDTPGKQTIHSLSS